jgi:hypothetical protein
MRLVAIGCVVVPVALATAFMVATAWGAGNTSAQIYAATCAVSTGRWPANAPPRTTDGLNLGPVIFNNLGQRAGRTLRPPVVLRPQRGDRLYHVVSFFNIRTGARGGVVVRLIGGIGRVAILFDHYPGTRDVVTGKLSLAKAPRSVLFPLCYAAGTNKPQVTQYGISFLMQEPGCFTVEVQPVGRPQRYRATLRTLVSVC